MVDLITVTERWLRAKSICVLSGVCFVRSVQFSQEFVLYVLYRSPNVPIAQFLDDFGLFLEGAALSGSEHMLLCDLNINLDNQDSWSKQFNDVFKQYSFA